MPKFPTIPRISIVVPIGDDLAAFETTLVSILENRPVGCEVLVASDGTYDDPFDLRDEVRFVVGASQSLVDLVSASAAESRGRFVHVIQSGVKATPGWIDSAIEKFEHFDAAVVSPVIRQAQNQQIIAAGWRDTGARLCDPAYAGQNRITARRPEPVGAYLQASLWRREILVSLADAYQGRDSLAASYAYDHLIRAAGWRCVLAPESNLELDSDCLPWDHSSSATRQTASGHSLAFPSERRVGTIHSGRGASCLGQCCESEFDCGINWSSLRAHSGN